MEAEKRLESVTIGYDDFPDLDEPQIYDLGDATRNQIFLFFDRIGYQDANFFLDSEAKGKIDIAQLSVYKMFGIYTDDTMLVDEHKNYLLILEPRDLVSESALELAVEQQKERYGCKEFKFAAIKKNYSSDIGREEDNDLIFQVLSNITVFNRGFAKKTVYAPQKLKFDDKSKYVNMADLFEELVFDSNVAFLNMQNVCKVYDKMLQYQGKKVIFYCENTDPDGITNKPSCKYVVTAMAAYFALVYGYRFEFTRAEDRNFLLAARDLLSRDYNYLDEYFNFVKHPLNVGFKITDNRMYLMIRDDNKLQKQKADYTTKVEMLCIPFDKESKAIKNTVVERKIYTLDALKYESLEDCFSLGDDNWEKAKEGVNQLSSVFGMFERLLKKNSLGPIEPLFVNNTILFKEGEEYYLGYVHDLKGKVPYVVVDADYRHKPFQEDIEINRLNNVYDVNLLTDRHIIAKLVKETKWGGGVIEHYKLPKYAHGIIFKNLLTRATRLNEDCGATVEELGFWMTTTSQLRLNGAANVLKYISTEQARSSNLLTCFGGPHQSITVDIVLDEDYGGDYV